MRLRGREEVCWGDGRAPSVSTWDMNASYRPTRRVGTWVSSLTRLLLIPQRRMKRGHWLSVG